ncbi:MAG: MBL fold metallo-hydrolase, partial [Rhodospirillales bacterium]|nr:MBL fold metallo-hydrolase [Rhodospirillales bacterium]
MSDSEIAALKAQIRNRPRVTDLAQRRADSDARGRAFGVPQGVTIATDYNDFVRPRETPDIATMNHAHSTHYTDHPDPAIQYVLRGWGTSPDQPARHDLQYRDVRVRNVPTNIRTWNGATERHGNSIFVFEISGLCIAHLGHLHHTLTQQQLDEIGRVDVVMAPVDGSVTLDLDGMIEVLQALQAPLVIPMHYFGMVSLRRFLDALGGKSYDVETSERSSIVVSKATLPAGPIAFVSQSGAFGNAAMAALAEARIGMSKLASVGNMADLNHALIFRYLKDDPQTNVI